MIAEIYWIESLPIGRIAIMPRPRGGDWLEDEIFSLVRSGVNVLVSLLTKEEESELDLSNESRFCFENGIEFIKFPIKDRDVPNLNDCTVNFLNKLRQKILENKSVAIHCRIGIGRSALIIAAVMVFMGIKPQLAFEKIEKARKCKVPDTEQQKQWIYELANEYKNGI